jgi:hypothetical protein
MGALTNPLRLKGDGLHLEMNTSTVAESGPLLEVGDCVVDVALRPKAYLIVCALVPVHVPHVSLCPPSVQCCF